MPLLKEITRLSLSLVPSLLLGGMGKEQSSLPAWSSGPIHHFGEMGWAWLYCYRKMERVPPLLGQPRTNTSKCTLCLGFALLWGKGGKQSLPPARLSSPILPF